MLIVSDHIPVIGNDKHCNMTNPTAILFANIDSCIDELKMKHIKRSISDNSKGSHPNERKTKKKT